MEAVKGSKIKVRIPSLLMPVSNGIYLILVKSCAILGVCTSAPLSVCVLRLIALAFLRQASHDSVCCFTPEC